MGGVKIILNMTLPASWNFDVMACSCPVLLYVQCLSILTLLSIWPVLDLMEVDASLYESSALANSDALCNSTQLCSNVK